MHLIETFFSVQFIHSSSWKLKSVANLLHLCYAFQDTFQRVTNEVTNVEER